MSALTGPRRTARLEFVLYYTHWPDSECQRSAMAVFRRGTEEGSHTLGGAGLDLAGWAAWPASGAAPPGLATAARGRATQNQLLTDTCLYRQSTIQSSEVGPVVAQLMGGRIPALRSCRASLIGGSIEVASLRVLS